MCITPKVCCATSAQTGLLMFRKRIAWQSFFENNLADFADVVRVKKKARFRPAVGGISNWQHLLFNHKTSAITFSLWWKSHFGDSFIDIIGRMAKNEDEKEIRNLLRVEFYLWTKHKDIANRLVYRKYWEAEEIVINITLSFNTECFFRSFLPKIFIQNKRRALISLSC